MKEGLAVEAKCAEASRNRVWAAELDRTRIVNRRAKKHLQEYIDVFFTVIIC